MQLRCISFIFYIKPQLCSQQLRQPAVVYLSFSTSNHNGRKRRAPAPRVVYLSFSTSNHNYFAGVLRICWVVYLSFSTSNHNFRVEFLRITALYIFHFLHQTTTASARAASGLCCISFIFYIKPQHIRDYSHFLLVVYLSFSTSNHNEREALIEDYKLYIFHFLHQTTTQRTLLNAYNRCISFIFYIKPQLKELC